MNAIEQSLLAKIRQLPVQRLAEVEDFVDFLRTREHDGQLTLAARGANHAVCQVACAAQVDA